MYIYIYTHIQMYVYIYVYIYIYTIAPVGMKNSIGKTNAQNAMVVFVLKRYAKLY